VCLSIWSVVFFVQSGFSQTEIDFSRDIKPLLAANCFQCHGPDENQREGDLRFDRERSNFAAVIGTPGDSELLDRITSSDPDQLMPPPESNLQPLKPEEVQLFRRWLQAGGKVSGHWSYQALRRPPVPAVKNKGWPKNTVDRFVLSGLEARGLAPRATADWQTLLRRVSLDLVGLPPRVVFTDALPMPPSYETAVEQLLASPSYGERMAIDWLDLVRYADTSGIHSDNPISMSPYRDYVINAFNDNLPFDQFTREQIAGDLLPNATLQQKIASAYNRLNMMTTEGGAQDKEYLAKYAADRVRTTSITWLGSTLGCAECHNHKYDPFSTRDFYQFAAFFADVTEKGYYPGAERSGDWGPKLEIPDATQRNQQQKMEKELALAQKTLRSKQAEALKSISQWERSVSQSPSWKFLPVDQIASREKSTFKKLPDGSFLATGPRPAMDSYVLTVSQLPKKMAALRLEVLPHDSLPKKGPGRAPNGNFVLTEIKANLINKAHRQEAQFNSAFSTFDQTLAGEHTHYKVWHAQSAIDRDRHGAKPGWAILPKIGTSQSAVFVFEKPVVVDARQSLEIQLEQNHDNPGHLIGRFRLSACEEVLKGNLASMNLPPAVREAVKAGVGHRSEEQQRLVEKEFFKSRPEIQELESRVARLEKERVDQRKSWVTVLTTVSRKPREMRILPRGDWLDESGPVVTSQTPAFLFALPKQRQDSPNRLDLANWLVARENPLTARVQVNRLWKKFFGTGLVSTSDDFGSQGRVPTHPNLLDFLAMELVESDWDVKHVVRLIVNSAAYQQSSTSSQQLDELDPANRWLARQNRFRVEAELVRDQALAASGLWVNQIGGPSVKPYQPEGYYQHLNFPKRKYAADGGSKQYRSGLYTHWQRLFLHPALLAFDAPSREECTAERVRSNTPQQALVLLNDPSFIEAARVFASKVIRSGDRFEARVEFAFQWSLGRSASPAEIAILKRVHDSQLPIPSPAGSTEGAILEVGQAKQIFQRQLIAWTGVARVLFNLHEFTTRY
ncbi:MAG: PSD1 and planctomycete cytochrome C domain-containing protein, partial [Planctomycetota bacterium]|nr:PSD1 and planctomycete cytochrome C domain-containing protein [Planctomycetota bacterium]